MTQHYEGRAVYATKGDPARWVNVRHVDKGIEIVLRDTAVLSVEQAERLADLILDLARTHPGNITVNR